MTGAEWFSTVPAGLNRYFTDLYSALAATGEIVLTAAAFGEPAPGGLTWGPAGGSTLGRVAAALRPQEVAGSDIIVDRHFCLYGGPLLAGGRAKHLVVHFHGPWAAESRISGESHAVVRTKYWVERVRHSGARRIVVLSEHFRRLLIDDYRVPEQIIEVIPGGVDLRRFGSTEDIPTTNGPVVLCVRRMERRMGIPVLVRAWRSVLSEFPDATLVLAGTGDEEAALRTLVAESGMAGSISFAGRVSDSVLARLYGEAAVTVVPSIALEGFGLIALESLAAGRAPVVTDCGGLPEVVRGLDPSLVVAAGDADALGARIVEALNGRRPTPAQCRRHAEGFSWDLVARRHLDLYTDLIA